ncbi:chloride channel protein [Longimicrobium terrae]|uniref:CIC family chloride channel protein n=1 Tax=Longimicrobium terrae TaxID=1639882 RepID=A0A841H322_9BACT|nr:chloride channel protein [Longimicrobium terrae]MBB4637776.1 CIC family chloride channel protein [Longimicrobium terrae]MBB6072368.1 CIC family chloride channel protein [Longimicrobium terrae]NNC31286.1 CBS domain-containing protein [Longimicrobium terrae]
MRRGAQALAAGWERFVQWFNALGLSENTILFAFAAAVGLASALGVIAFYGFIDAAYTLFYTLPARFRPRSAFLAYRPLVTGAGFALAWWIMRRIGRGHEGMNVPDVQLAVARDGRIAFRPALARTAASAVTLGCGGSAGSEGPVAVLGSAVGSFLGRTFRFDPGRIRVLVAAGAAAGISAAFNAPLTGAFFALEEILGSLAVAAFPAVVVSSVIGAMVSRAFFGNHPAFPIPAEYGYGLVREVVLLYPLLGLLVGGVSASFIRCYFGVGRLVQRMALPAPLVPWIGGALVGGMVYLSGGRLVGFGHLAVRLDVFGQMAWYSLALLAIGKIVATSITLNSGASGGVFTPSLYLGAATGGGFGVAAAALFPGMGIQPQSYALVGMGAVVAASTGAPITGILIVFEMTQDSAIMLPLMLTTVIGYAAARWLEPDNLYSGWLRRRGERIHHGADEGVLARHRVAELYDRAPRTLREDAGPAEMLAVLESADETELPVVDADGRCLGLVTVQDLARLMGVAGSVGGLVMAADLAAPAETVSPSDTLLTVIRRMGTRGIASLPVVEPGTERLLGVVSRQQVMAVYERSVSGAHD